MRHISNFRKKQRKTIEELKKHQLNKLKQIIKYSYEHSPYYHNVLKSVNFKPEDLRSKEDLKKIPITTKMDVKNSYHDFMTKNLVDSKYKSYTTSGSTGIPLTFLHDNKSHFYANTSIMYNFLECGVKFKDRFVNLSPRQFPDGSLISKPTFSRLHFLGIVLNITNLSIYSYREYIDSINKIKPDVLYGFPNAIVDMCEVKTLDINPRLVFTQGEVLTDHSRDIIERELNAEVYNTYGCSEVPRIAFECNEHSGLHTLTDSVVVECIKDDDDVVGEPGEVVITGLYNYFMPLIRYELGDSATPTDEVCPCGRNWPLIKNIQGRINDFFILPSGKILTRNHTLEWFKPEFKKNIWLFSKYQFVQEEKNKIVLNIVKGKNYDENVMDRILSIIHEDLKDEGLEFIVVTVDDIPKEKSGKRRSMISLDRSRCL
jgi:phenylacetate-CoA ligase